MFGGLIGKIFGTDKAVGKIVDGAIDGIDALIYTDEEKATDAKKERAAKRKYQLDLIRTKAELKSVYHPYKLTQRIIALSAWFTFLTIMVVGIFTILFGDGDLSRIKLAISFANELWLGQIIFAIISFYFGYDMTNKFLGKK